MPKISDLKEISNAEQIVETLDSLLVNTDEEGNFKPVITGYNYYDSVPESESNFTITNIHETDPYLQDMFDDLIKFGYTRTELESYIRNKTSVFISKKKFITTDDEGKKLKGQRVKRVFKTKDIRRVILEDDGWEINIPCETIEQTIDLADLFLKKGDRLTLTRWRDAYATPTILITSNNYLEPHLFDHYYKAYKLLKKAKSNEMNSVVGYKEIINKNTKLKKLIETENFSIIDCLVNNKFMEYITKKKKI